MGTIEPFLAKIDASAASGSATAAAEPWLALRESQPLGLVLRPQAPSHSDTDLTGYGHAWFR